MSATVSDTVSSAIAEHVAASRFERLPDAAVQAAKRSTLDTLAAMLAGSGAEGLEAITGLATDWGGAPQARLLATGIRAPAPLAAWCNGAMARALEIDDCVDFLPLHPSASAVPALLALADSRPGLSGREFLTALAVGQDLKIRLGQAVRHNAMQSGRNNLFKIFGPAAAVARALKLDAPRTGHALGIAFSHAVGDGQCALEGALSLRLQQGIVAQGALVSALLAERGFTGSREFLLGRWGYLRSFEPDPLLEPLCAGLGERFLGESISVKPYAACRATHEAIDLALALRAAISAEVDAVQAIRLVVTPEVERLVGLPRESRLAPASSADAQFSLPYTVAVALQRGRMFLDDIDEAAYTDPQLRALARRVDVVGDPAMRTDLVIGRTRLQATLREGGAWQAECDAPSGSPSRPPSPAQMRAKLAACAARAQRVPGPAALEVLAERIDRLETLADVRQLVDALDADLGH